MALPRACRANINVKRSITCETDPGVFLCTAGAALHERRKSNTVTPAADLASLNGLLFAPADLLQGLFKDRGEIAGIEFGRRLVGDQPADAEWHLLCGH